MVFLLLISISALNYAIFLPINEAELAHYFQNICKNMSPSHSEFSALYAATICGINPPPSAMIWDFRNSGLYHLIVVSGAHLIFCVTILDRIFFFGPKSLRNFLKAFTLVAYSLFSGLNPPVVRALVGLLLAATNERLELRWSGGITVIFSGLVCLAIFPAWWGSLSFLMSWSAAFALTLASSALMKCVAVYALMLVPMCALGLNSPMTVLSNWLLAPVMGFVLLPVSVLPFLDPRLVVFSDWIWRLLVFVVHWVSQLSVTSAQTYQIPKELMWLFLLGLQLGLYEYNVYRRRREF